MYGNTIGVFKWDIKSLDKGSYVYVYTFLYGDVVSPV